MIVPEILPVVDMGNSAVIIIWSIVIYSGKGG